MTRRFFLILQYEAAGRDDGDYARIVGSLQAAEQTARAYFLQCGNSIVQPANPDEATAEILYQIFNRRSCQTEPFLTRVDRVVLDAMLSQGLTVGLDPVPEIPVTKFLAPRGIDLTHRNYILMDGRYYTVLYIRGNGYPSRVRAGWMSALISTGEGIGIDIHLRRENRSKAIDKVAQRIRLNRTKLKGMKAIRLRTKGYSTGEIGETRGAPDNHVTAWEARARKVLKTMGKDTRARCE